MEWNLPNSDFEELWKKLDQNQKENLAVRFSVINSRIPSQKAWDENEKTLGIWISNQFSMQGFFERHKTRLKDPKLRLQMNDPDYLAELLLITEPSKDEKDQIFELRVELDRWNLMSDFIENSGWFPSQYATDSHEQRLQQIVHRTPARRSGVYWLVRDKARAVIDANQKTRKGYGFKLLSKEIVLPLIEAKEKVQNKPCSEAVARLRQIRMARPFVELSKGAH